MKRVTLPKLPKIQATAETLLGWYDRHHRELPWRISPAMAKRGVLPNPYHIWMSEVMLQQTTVAAVKAYFAKFVDRWPKVEDLAHAPTEDVMAAWAGLGYYARARNLKKCAEAVAFEHGGVFPGTEEGLRALPGIGDYTSAAVAAIAFNRQAAVMDGNVERVISRLFAIDAPLPGSKPQMKARVAEMTPADRPGDFAQAYVIAHEVGHHVQNQLGISGKVDQMRGRVSKAEYNALSVRLELQADCFAGVWAHHAQRSRQVRSLARRQPRHQRQQALQLRCVHHPLPVPSTRGSQLDCDSREAHGVSLSLINAERAPLRP